MPEVKGNQVVTNFDETKQVLSLAIGLVKAYQLSQEDGVINWTDVVNFLPVLPLLGPAIDNIGGVEPEFRMATQEDTDNLKTWLGEQLVTLDTEEKMKAFIEGAFGIAMGVWVLVRDFTAAGEPTPEGTEPADAPELSSDDGVEDNGPHKDIPQTPYDGPFETEGPKSGITPEESAE